MQQIRLVSHPEIDRAWADSLPLIQKLLKRDKSLRMGFLLEGARSGQLQMWVVWDGATINAVAFIRFEDWGDDGMVARVVALGGQNLKEWKHLIPRFNVSMKNLGASSVVFEGRKGWAREIKARIERVSYKVQLHGR